MLSRQKVRGRVETFVIRGDFSSHTSHDIGNRNLDVSDDGHWRL
jgi:hypothetical protein